MGVVAILGRPNVGKSALFNRLTRSQAAIVHDEPGVTRDRHYGVARHGEKSFTIVDTGGLDPLAQADIFALMRAQALVAIEQCDLILCLFDVREGPSPVDHAILDVMRTSAKPVLYAVNKVDGPKDEWVLGDFYSLGISTLYPISALHGRGIWELLDGIVEQLGPDDPQSEPSESDGIRVSVVGRPNVGKSTLINRLLGEQRLLTSDEPGTTRDAIDTFCRRGEQPYTLIDTAGLRRKRGISEDLERHSILRAVRAIERCDVALLIVDAEEGVVEQDAKIAGLINDRGRACVIVVNKWDLASREPQFAQQFVERIRDRMKFLRYAPVILVSAKTGRHTEKIFEWIDKVYAAYNRRISTGELNRLLATAIEQHQPPIHHTRRVKIYYWTQVSTHPPTIVALLNDPLALHFSYQRYLLNVLRSAFDFEGTPVRLRLRARRQKDPDDASK